MTSARAPFVSACVGVRKGSPVVTCRAFPGVFTDAAFRRPVAQAEGGLGIAGFCCVAQKEQEWLRQGRDNGWLGQWLDHSSNC